MPITLTSDPIVSEAVVQEMLGIAGDEARLLINSASVKFKNYTGRLRIINGAVTEYQRGSGSSKFWLHATPITALTSVQIMSDGAVSETVTSYDYDAATGRFALHNRSIPLSEDENTLKVVYTAGWAAVSVPGDIMEGALELMRVEQDRRKGRAGVKSESMGGHSVTFQTGDLPESVAQAWDPYRFMI